MRQCMRLGSEEIARKMKTCMKLGGDVVYSIPYTCHSSFFNLHWSFIFHWSFSVGHSSFFSCHYSMKNSSFFVSSLSIGLGGLGSAMGSSSWNHNPFVAMGFASETLTIAERGLHCAGGQQSLVVQMCPHLARGSSVARKDCLARRPATWGLHWATQQGREPASLCNMQICIGNVFASEVLAQLFGFTTDAHILET